LLWLRWCARLFEKYVKTQGFSQSSTLFKTTQAVEWFILGLAAVFPSAHAARKS